MLQVSVILCCHNGEDDIANALDSAVAQTMSSSQYEIIIVDDGSTDGTAQVVSSFLDANSNCRYVRAPEHRGLVATCNLGLEVAKGTYVVRLDHDDTFEPPILDALVRPLEQNQTDLVYSDRYEVVASKGRVEYVCLDEFNLFCLTAAGVMMRRDWLLDVGGYRPLFWEEYDLYLRYAQKSGRPFYRVPQALYRYNRRAGSLTMSVSGEAVRKGWEELIEEWGEETLRRFGWDSAVLEN